MELIKKQTHIDFMGKFKVAMVFSALLILGGIVSIVMHGGLKYGIDFKGGSLVQLRFGVTMIPIKVDKPSSPIETINSKLNGIKKLKNIFFYFKLALLKYIFALVNSGFESIIKLHKIVINVKIDEMG